MKDKRNLIFFLCLLFFSLLIGVVLINGCSNEEKPIELTYTQIDFDNNIPSKTKGPTVSPTQIIRLTDKPSLPSPSSTISPTPTSESIELRMQDTMSPTLAISQSTNTPKPTTLTKYEIIPNIANCEEIRFNSSDIQNSVELGCLPNGQVQINYQIVNGWIAARINLDEIALLDFDHISFLANARHISPFAKIGVVTRDSNILYSALLTDLKDVDQIYEIPFNKFVRMTGYPWPCSWDEIEELWLIFESDLSGHSGSFTLKKLIIERRFIGAPTPDPLCKQNSESQIDYQYIPPIWTYFIR